MATNDTAAPAAFTSSPITAKQIQQSLQQGEAPDGKPATVVTLTNSQGMSVSIMDIGATWVSCQLPVENGRREILLGMLTQTDYANHSAYLGAIIGRFANRIAQGRFMLNGNTYQLAVNDGANSLHGGTDGFDVRRWTIAEQGRSYLVLRLESPDGDQGFPGNIAVEVAYTLTDNNQLCIDYSAICDQDCPINLTNHAYFNLDGAESGHSILNHRLQLNSDYYAATDDALIPTGELRPVKGSPFDFNIEHRIGARLLLDDAQKTAKGYDHAFTLSPDLCDGITPVATLTSSDNKVTMAVLTDKPAIQLYTGNYLAGTPSRNGIYQDYQGVALETQFLPDSPNQPGWPGENRAYIPQKAFYQYQTSYQFTF